MRILVLAFVLVGSGLPALSDSMMARAGWAGGEGWGGLSVGVDYLDCQGGRRPILLSLDEALNLTGLVFWPFDGSSEADDFTALVVSRPTSAGSPVFLGAGLAWIHRANGNEASRPLLRLTLTTDPGKFVVGQVRLNAADSIGVIADLSLGMSF